MLRILFNVREDYLSNLGGDTIQILKTAEALQKFNIKVDISTLPNPDLRNYDVIHLFNLITLRETYFQCKNAIKYNKPIALSTIYWNMDELYKKGLYNPFKRILHRVIKSDETKLRLKKIINFLFKNKFLPAENVEINIGFKNQQKFILHNSDILLPNSEMEMNMIKNDLNIKKRYIVVPNAVDQQFKYSSPAKFIKKYGNYGLKKNKFVLCVCRIEERKNILRLIKAVNNTNLKLVIIGKPNPSQYHYYKKCRKIAEENIIFLNHMNHDDLSSAYAAAKVHILPSWYETPGLSSLEAGLAGCNVVSTNIGSTKEYFKNFVEYCSPSSMESIRKTVIKAFNKQKTSKLNQHISENYTWKKSAEQTLKAYKQILRK